MLFSNKNLKLKTRSEILFFTFFITISLGSIFVNSRFIGNTEFQIETSQFSQYYGCSKNAPSCSDGTGGAFVVWNDDRDDNCDIYAQRVNSTGDVEWKTNGIAICSANNGQTEAQIIYDGVGNAIIVWLDNRDGYNWNIYAQKVNSSGDVQWESDGKPICSVSGHKVDVQICSDSSGGAIIAWIDNRSVDSGIYAQKVNSIGDVQWLTSGKPICTGTDYKGIIQEYKGTIQICSDGNDGAIITWQDERSGERDIYSQRINSSGQVLWMYNGVAICVANGDQFSLKMCRDGMNGTIMSWVDQRSGSSHIYTQRIDSFGNVQWAVGGEYVSLAGPYDQEICSDGLNGAFITSRTREGDIYAQRINSSGDEAWVDDGIAICTADERQDMPQICNSGGDNAIITWLDPRNKKVLFEIYAQGINSTGSVKWMTNGVPICTEDNSQIEPRICSDDADGAIILWIDERYPKQSIYAQRINSTGAVLWTANGIPIRSEGEPFSGFVSGYNLLFLLGILSVGAFLLSNKIKKS